jgi:hypothetical protein
MRISSSSEHFQATSNKDNTPAFWLKKLRLPKPCIQAPCRLSLVSNVLHSRILARVFYNMCSTLAFWLSSQIERAPLSHSGAIIVVHVLRSRILAQFSYSMCSTLAFWLGCCSTCAPLSHSGSIIVSHVLRSSILA